MVAKKTHRQFKGLPQQHQAAKLPAGRCPTFVCQAMLEDLVLIRADRSRWMWETGLPGLRLLTTDPVDGSEIRRITLGWFFNPINNGIIILIIILGGAGFCPSTVSCSRFNMLLTYNEMLRIGWYNPWNLYQIDGTGIVTNINDCISRWCFQIFLLCSSLAGEMIQFH